MDISRHLAGYPKGDSDRYPDREGTGYLVAMDERARILKILEEAKSSDESLNRALDELKKKINAE
jgi:hypothetical protein